MNWVMSVIVRAPTAADWAFEALVVWWIFRSRSSGSDSSLWSVTLIIEMTLPAVSFSSPVRTEMGAIADRVSSGSSPWCWRYWRRAPLQTASTTSLTVAPGMRLRMSRMSWSEKVRPSTTRCGETAALKRVRGTGPEFSTSSSGVPRKSRASPGAVLRMADANRKGVRMLFTVVRSPSSKKLGGRSGTHRFSGGGGAPVGSRSWIAVASSAPDTPSIAA